MIDHDTEEWRKRRMHLHLNSGDPTYAIYQWLIDNQINCNAQTLYDLIYKWGNIEGEWCLPIYIKNPSDQMLFKLTWGDYVL